MYQTKVIPRSIKFFLSLNRGIGHKMVQIPYFTGMTVVARVERDLCEQSVILALKFVNFFRSFIFSLFYSHDKYYLLKDKHNGKIQF